MNLLNASFSSVFGMFEPDELLPRSLQVLEVPGGQRGWHLVVVAAEAEANGDLHLGSLDEEVHVPEVELIEQRVDRLEDAAKEVDAVDHRVFAR